MQTRWIVWLINLCLLATVLLAVIIVSIRGLYDWWLQMGHVSVGVAAIWLKISFGKIFGRRQRLPFYVGVLVAVLLLLHLSSWLFVGEQSDISRVILILSQDLLIVAAILALYYPPQGYRNSRSK